MNILDDLNKVKQIDRENILKVGKNFYSQLLEARDISEKVDLKKIKMRTYSGIAFLGMGGSGFTGDIIKDLVKDDTGFPVMVVKSYNLPSFISDEWLVVSVSYSGNTEETVSASYQALERGSEVIFVTSGGKLEDMAKDYNKCIIKIPSNFQPRAAIGYLFFSTFLVLNYLKIFNIPEKDIEEALNIIKEKCRLYEPRMPSGENFAKSIALSIGDNLPIIYGTDGFLSSVAFRWKCEINENAKTPSFWAEFPELNHNETVGWERLKNVTEKFVLIVFREKDEDLRIKTRIETTVKLIKDNFSEVIEILVEGKSKLSRALSTMYLGDMVSIYLAVLHGIDPTPVEKINVLKAELSKLK